MHIRHKFDDRAKPHIFVGYPYGQKGYRVYDPYTRRVFVSRDVIFHESIFPYRDVVTSPPSKDIVITAVDDDQPNRESTPNSIPNHISSPESQLSDFGSPHVYDDTQLSSHDTCSTPQVVVVPKRPQRIRRPPAHLSGYVCNVEKSSMPFPLAHYISWNNLSPSHRSFPTKVIDNDEPRTYSQAVKSHVWCDAMSVEIRALTSNNTWSLCSLPSRKTPIGCKWVYKIKYRSGGSIDRYKARIVAKE